MWQKCIERARLAQIIMPLTIRGAVRRERVGTAFPHLFHVLLWNELEAVSKWLFSISLRSHIFLLALHPCLLCNCATPHAICIGNTEEYWTTARGLTSWDGARGKKQVFHPHVWTWGLSEANVLHWSTSNIARTFLRPAVIWRPHSDSAPGELCRLSPVVRPWLLRAPTRLNKPW